MFDHDNKIDVLLVAAAVAITATVFFLVNKPVDDGKVEELTDTKITEKRSNVPPPITQNTESYSNSKKRPVDRNVVYKWVDNEGTVHYSDKPISNESQSLQVVSIDPNMNTIQPPKAAPTIETSKKQNVTSTNTDNTLETYERICNTHSYGSIAYRQCRKSVHSTLKKNCFEIRSRLNTATDEQYQSLKRSEEQICSAYRKYAAVK
jgi:hypothetical protein